MSSWGRLKRTVYGLPLMAPYRAMRTAQLASRHERHPLGFWFAGQKAFFSPAWEPRERAVIADCLTRASVFIDVGANQGVYTCLASSLGIATAAVEPEAGNLRFLLSNVERNGYDGTEIFPVAVSDKAGVARFYGDGHIASLVPGWHRVRSDFSRLAAVNTLDNLFAERWSDQAMLIKVDVEGVEHAVLAGARQLLARSNKPTWIIETFLRNRDQARSANPHFRDLFALMSAHRYRCTRVDTGEAVTLDDVDRWVGDPDRASLGLSNYLFEHDRHPDDPA